jgi:hypothetical protein
MSSQPPDPVTSIDGIVVGVLRTHNPEILDMWLATTEAEFLGVAERGLDRCIRKMESSRREYRLMPEVGLSKMLADMLSLAGFNAEAEARHNGHVDVTIRHYDPAKFTYLGECKIHDGYQHHRDGCVQVFGYCSGREQRVFCLDFFIQHDGMYTKLAALRERFDEDEVGVPRQLGPSRDHFIKGAFLTVHHHPTGAGVELLHLGCNLHEADAPSRAPTNAGASKKAAKPARARGVAK